MVRRMVVTMWGNQGRSAVRKGRVLWVVVAVAGLVGCGDTEQEAVSPPGVFVEEPEIAGVLGDSTWQELGPSVFGGPSSSHEGKWIVEARWYRFAARPESIYTYSEMAWLDAEGVIDDETMVGPVQYRFLIEAEDYPEARREVAARVEGPGWPPEMVYEAMAEADGRKKEK